MLPRTSLGVAALAASVGLCATLHAQPADAPKTLPQISVTGKRIAARKPARRAPAPHPAVAAAPAPPPAALPAVSNPYATPPVVQRYQLPTESF